MKGLTSGGSAHNGSTNPNGGSAHNGASNSQGSVKRVKAPATRKHVGV
jgi:hypothetical protein